MCWKILKSIGSVLSVVGVLIVGPTLAFAEEGAPRIQMGEMFFAVPGGKQISFPTGTAQPKSIMTIQGAETGRLTFVIENVGELLHEIRSPLFMAAKEVKAEIMDSEGEMVAESEGTDLLELELAPGYSAVLHIQLAGAVKKSFKKDPQLALDYEISCHVEGHYEAGMRGLITLVGSSQAS